MLKASIRNKKDMDKISKYRINHNSTCQNIAFILFKLLSQQIVENQKAEIGWKTIKGIKWKWQMKLFGTIV